jgi:hypothetical protein
VINPEPTACAISPRRRAKSSRLGGRFCAPYVCAPALHPVIQPCIAPISEPIVQEDAQGFVGKIISWRGHPRRRADGPRCALRSRKPCFLDRPHVAPQPAPAARFLQCRSPGCPIRWCPCRGSRGAVPRQQPDCPALFLRSCPSPDRPWDRLRLAGTPNRSPARGNARCCGLRCMKKMWRPSNSIASPGIMNSADITNITRTAAMRCGSRSTLIHHRDRTPVDGAFPLAGADRIGFHGGRTVCRAGRFRRYGGPEKGLST